MWIKVLKPKDLKETEEKNKSNEQGVVWLCIKFLNPEILLPGIYIHEECHKVQENHLENIFDLPFTLA